MQICAQRHRVATDGYMFPGSAAKPYKVTAFRPHELPFCNCQAYIFGRSKIAKAEGVPPASVSFVCKHLEVVLRDTCDWIQERPDEYQYGGKCPKCGGELVDDTAPVMSEDPADQVDDLRALLADLRGEEAPAPLPKPTSWTVEFTFVTTHAAKVMALTEDEARETLSESYGYHLDSEVDRRFGEITSVKPTVEEAPAPAPKPSRKPRPKPESKRATAADVAALVKQAKGA